MLRKRLKISVAPFPPIAVTFQLVRTQALDPEALHVKSGSITPQTNLVSPQYGY